MAQIFELLTALLTALQCKNTKQTWKNTHSKIINTAMYKTCKNSLLDVENAILIRYYYYTVTTRSLYESTDGPAGQPADKQPNSDRLWDVQRTVPELAVQVYWPPGPPIRTQVGSDPSPDPTEGCSETVTETTNAEIWRLPPPYTHP